MIEVAYPLSNLKPKQMVYYLIFLPLHKKFAKGFTLILLHITVVEVPAIFINADTRLKEYK